MATKQAQYIEGIGRRKTASARVRITEGKKQEIVVNDRPFEEHFKTATQQKTILDVFDQANIEQQFSVSVHVKGGGVPSQAEAIRLGIARALVKRDAEMRGTLKKAGYLKRDPRTKERKKFGLKKARKSPQWSKR